jgi:hypothetical protein
MPRPELKDKDLLVDLDCPACAGTVPATVGQVRVSATVSCDCGQRIKIDGRELAAELQKLEDPLDRFGR